jgi:hypothetical protein
MSWPGPPYSIEIEIEIENLSERVGRHTPKLPVPISISIADSIAISILRISPRQLPG